MKKVLLGIIKLYRMTSPARRARCRYFPTCSQYAQQALEQHGSAKGSWLGIRRLLRCHPFGSYGFDPVPDK